MRAPLPYAYLPMRVRRAAAGQRLQSRLHRTNGVCLASSIRPDLCETNASLSVSNMLIVEVLNALSGERAARVSPSAYGSS